MTGAQPADENRARPPVLAGRSNLMLRIGSSLVLAPVAIAAAYFGGLAFVVFWAIAALAVLWEWDTLVCADDRNAVLATGAVALAGSALVLALGRSGIAIAIIALGVLGAAALTSKVRRGWCAGGLVYAAAILIAPVLLRHDASLGFAAILFLFVIVWLTDITAYFVGRALGGPKLMPRVSPNKTWSGALGGTAAGDLAESAIKRRFNAKDASQLIPGHGGLMDRLDGFVAAVSAATLIGIAHGGFDNPARGLMVW
jgi:phosphatidate cytidylyltransferase